MWTHNIQIKLRSHVCMLISHPVDPMQLLKLEGPVCVYTVHMERHRNVICTQRAQLSRHRTCPPYTLKIKFGSTIKLNTVYTVIICSVNITQHNSNSKGIKALNIIQSKLIFVEDRLETLTLGVTPI